MSRGPGRADLLLLAEIGLGLLLFVLFLVLYWVPAGAEGVFVPRWWAWPLLGVVFFAILALEGRRRRYRERSDLKRALNEALDERHSDRPGPPEA